MKVYCKYWVAALDLEFSLRKSADGYSNILKTQQPTETSYFDDWFRPYFITFYQKWTPIYLIFKKAVVFARPILKKRSCSLACIYICLIYFQVSAIFLKKAQNRLIAFIIKIDYVDEEVYHKFTCKSASESKQKSTEVYLALKSTTLSVYLL